ncbi:MAG: hypothetical protein R8K50_05915 [Mariprofundus sp.]
MRWPVCSMLVLLMFAVLPAQAADRDYLYYRDANVPPFQTSREFFDMPNRPGLYEVTLISESTGPLTFRMARAHEERETTVIQSRSYRVGNHEFQARFDNPNGVDNLIVEIANSNPLSIARVSVFVVELPR